MKNLMNLLSLNIWGNLFQFISTLSVYWSDFSLKTVHKRHLQDWVLLGMTFVAKNFICEVFSELNYKDVFFYSILHIFNKHFHFQNPQGLNWAVFFKWPILD